MDGTKCQKVFTKVFFHELQSQNKLFDDYFLLPFFHDFLYHPKYPSFQGYEYIIRADSFVPKLFPCDIYSYSLP